MAPDNPTEATPVQQTQLEMDWEVLVVGASYAGLSAALTLGRSRRATLVVGEGGPRNEAVHHAHGLLTRDGANPADLMRAAEAELEQYESVQLVIDRVRSVTPIDGGFRAQIGPRTVTARTIVLATGVNDDPLPVPGLADHWGRGVFTCPFCDGWEHRDLPLAVIAPPSFGAHLARILTMWTDRVILFAGDDNPAPDDPAAATLPETVEIERRSVRRVVGDGERVTGIELVDGSVVEAGAVFGSAVPRPNSQLAAELGCTLDDDGFVVVDPSQATSVPGVWAIGDLTQLRQFQMAFALSSGVWAAMGIIRSFLDT